MDIEKRLLDFRSRSYALAKLQASLEGVSIVEVIERAIESYSNDNIKTIIDSQYGEYEDRPKKPGRRKKKVDNTINTVNAKSTLESKIEGEKVIIDKVITDEISITNENNDKVEIDLVKDNKDLIIENEIIEEQEEIKVFTGKDIFEEEEKELEKDSKEDETIKEDVNDMEISKEDMELLALYGGL